MIVIHADIPVKQEKRSKAIEMSHEIAEQSRKEAGVIEYRVATDIEDETVIRFFERYEDETALEAHSESDHFAAFASELPELLDGEPTLMRFDVENASELEL